MDDLLGALFLVADRFMLMQRMVMSVASDKAVLDALLKNEKVHEFRRSFQQGHCYLHLGFSLRTLIFLIALCIHFSLFQINAWPVSLDTWE